MDSGDFLIETWADFFAQMEKQPAELRNPEHLVGLLVGMAKRAINREQQRVDTQKRDGGWHVSLAGNDPEIPDPHPLPMDSLIASEEWNRVLERHPAEHREMLRLFSN
jgi:hypothetical protein